MTAEELEIKADLAEIDGRWGEASLLWAQAAVAHSAEARRCARIAVRWATAGLVLALVSLALSSWVMFS